MPRTNRSRARAWPAAREVWALAWPAIVHLSVLTSVFVADRAIVGRLGASALAAMHGATTLSWTVASVLGAVSVGALATVGAHAGAGRSSEAAAATAGSVVLVTGLAVFAATLLWLLRDACLTWLFPELGVTAHRDASRYLAILLPALPLGLFASTASACLHALRDTRTPLVAALLGTTINLVVSPPLTLGLWGLPALGVAGAAIGTALAFVSQAVWLGQALSRSATLVGGANSWNVRRLWTVARPAFAERIAYHGSYLLYAGMVGALGPTAMAAHQGLLGIEAFSFTIAEGFGVAAGALVAHHQGSGFPDRARSTTVVAMFMASLALGGCALLLLAVRWMLARGPLSEGIVALELLTALPVAALAQPFVAIAVVGTAALRGAGNTRSALLVTLGGAVFVRLLSAKLLIAPYGLWGAWLAAALDWGTQAVVVGAWFARCFQEPATLSSSTIAAGIRKPYRRVDRTHVA